jgi:3alpha(or 20beta)-hydroxysteroid dehydrogenase
VGRVSGKVAIVTGAARGMGAAHARRLIDEGAKVVLTDILDREGAATARTLGENARFIRQDVSNEEEWRRVVSETETAFGPVSVLVNNAAIYTALASLETIEETDFRRVMDVNFFSVFFGMKTVIPSMRRAGGGSIINIAAYGSSKFAVRGITKSAALDVSQYGIRVNSVHPGFVETSMSAGAIPKEDTEAFIKTTSPLGRIAKPSEVSNLVLFLASDESSFSTGAEFIVDGGYTAR